VNHFRVAAGILRDADGRVLICERVADGPFRGLWEFPGGKIGPGETAADALGRELSEELGIRVVQADAFMRVEHAYPDRSVDLEFFLVTEWDGDPAGLDGQALRWVPPSALDQAELLPADAPVIDALTGP